MSATGEGTDPGLPMRSRLDGWMLTIREVREYLVELENEVATLRRDFAEREEVIRRLRASLGEREALRHETLEQALADNARLERERCPNPAAHEQVERREDGVVLYRTPPATAVMTALIERLEAFADRLDALRTP